MVNVAVKIGGYTQGESLGSDGGYKIGSSVEISGGKGAGKI